MKLWAQVKIHSPIPNLVSSNNSMASDTVDEGSNFDLFDDFLSANIVPNESTDVHGKNESLKLSYMKSSENVLNF